ncbi:23S rRNA (uracil-C(5))-methyltransferase RlmCD [bacterium BMS3Abin14]|nr:23S rRNA (uracil-C(5))-methyltransferase RlmCD [bacterium BMS3Abin14]
MVEGKSTKNLSGKTVRIEKLVTGGDGLGRLGDDPVFVPLTAPGDLVLPGVIKRRRGVLYAKAERLVEESPARRVPPCPYFQDCGGCNWMHLTCAAQAEWKAVILSETLRRIGGIDAGPGVETVLSPSEFGWRHRIRLHHVRGNLGFFRRGSHSLVSWDRCLLIPDDLNRAVSVLRASLAKKKGFLPLRSVEIALSPVDGNISVLWEETGQIGQVRLMGLMTTIEENLISAGLAGSCQGVISGSTSRVIRRQGSPLLLTGGAEATTLASPGTFFQVNPEQNKILVSRILSLLKERRVRSMVDLFCGNGNFSIPAAGRGIRVTGVDSSPGAVADAKAATCGGEVEFVLSDVDSYMAAQKHPDLDAVLVDPPRAGLSRAVKSALVSRRPGMIIYVSCDPATLARDLKFFVQSGYQLVSAEPFDMFPNSSHIETLAVVKNL